MVKAGYTLRAVGRLANAVEPIRIAAEAAAGSDRAQPAAGNLSELHLTLGNVTEATTTARRSIDFAVSSGDWSQQVKRNAELADALHQGGDRTQARAVFEEAERLQWPTSRNVRYCMRFRVISIANCSLIWANRRKWFVGLPRRCCGVSLYDIGLNHVSLGPPTPATHAKRVTTSTRRRLLKRAGTFSIFRSRSSHAAHPRTSTSLSNRQSVRHASLPCRLLSSLSSPRPHPRRPRSSISDLQKAQTLVRETSYHRRDSEIDLLGANLAA